MWSPLTINQWYYFFAVLKINSFRLIYQHRCVFFLKALMPFLLGNSLHVYIIVGFFSRHLSTFRCVQHKLHHTQLLMNSIQEVNYLTVLLYNELNSILKEHILFFYNQAFSRDIFSIPSKKNRNVSKINILCKCRSRKKEFSFRNDITPLYFKIN